MNITYKREMKHNYLIIEPEEIFYDSFEIHMMIANCIEGLLKFHVKQTDDRKSYYYEITSRQPLARLLDFHNIGAEELRYLIGGIGKTLGRLESYLLSENQILLEPEYIYVEPERFEVGLCLIPGKQGDFPADMTKLLQYLLGKVNHQDKECVVMAYGLYQESLKENYGMDDLFRMLNKGSEEEPVSEQQGKVRVEDERETDGGDGAEPDWIPQNKDAQYTDIRDWKTPFGLVTAAVAGGPVLVWLLFGKDGIMGYWYCLVGLDLVAIVFAIVLWGKKTSGVMRERNVDRQEETQTSKWQMIFEEEAETETPVGTERAAGEEKAARPENRDTGKLTGDANTVLLAEPSAECDARYLKSINHEIADIGISYVPFIIGKQEGLVDYALQRDTVSRIHVRIDKDGDEYSITDLNSTNGTSVRGRLLETNETVVMGLGDEIYIANIGFVFT